MTEKRFTFEFDNYNGRLFDNNYQTFYHIEDSEENIGLLCNRLNELHEENQELKRLVKATVEDYTDLKQSFDLIDKENEQLKKREEQLLSEIEDFQQLLTKNDNICYKRVIDLIDTQIKNGEEAIEWGKNMNADYGAMGFHIEMLKKLKKELE